LCAADRDDAGDESELSCCCSGCHDSGCHDDGCHDSGVDLCDLLDSSSCSCLSIDGGELHEDDDIAVVSLR